jgi:hypothetical protein
LVAFGVQDGKTHIRSWDLRSGTLLSDREAKLKVSYIPLIIGVAGGLFIDEAHNQVVYLGVQQLDTPTKPGRNKTAPPPTQVAVFAGVDLSTGESYKIESPKGTPSLRHLPRWSIVKGKLGTRLEDGSFAIYSGESCSFSEVMAIEGIANEWNTYYPNVGLVKETENGWQILSRDDLTPLDQPIDVEFEPGSEKITRSNSEWVSVVNDGYNRENMRGIFKLDNGDLGRWSLIHAGDDASDYVVFDVASHSEVTRSRYPLAATKAFRSKDGSRLLLEDDKHKKALWVNAATGATSEVDLSWAGLPYLVPVFEK